MTTRVLLQRNAFLRRCSVRAYSLAFSGCGNLRSYTATTGQAVTNLQPKPLHEMPGIKGWPILGDIKIMSRKDVGKPLEDVYLLKLSKKFNGTFKIKILGTWIVVIQAPEDVEAVYRSEGRYPSRGIEENVSAIYKHLDTPSPMFFSVNEEWKRIRSSASKQVVPRRVGRFVSPMCDIADDFITHLEEIMDEDGNISDIPPEVSKWTFQSVSYFVYGEKINTYSVKDPMQKEFVEAGSEFVQAIGSIAIALPLYRIFPTKPYRRFVKILKRMKKAGSEIVKKRAEMIKQDIENNQVDETKAIGLLDQWLIEQKFSEEEALSLSYDMMSAGIDTTAYSASCLLYELAKHPEIQDQLVKEIGLIVGDKDYPSWEDLQSMPLLRNCVKEIMRLHTVIPLQGRIHVVINMGSISKCEETFEHPTKFIPDRWNKAAQSQIHPFSSLPFGFGPRACYGRRLAEMEMFVLMIKLLPMYILSTNVKELELKYGTVCSPMLPLHINFTRRKI